MSGRRKKQVTAVENSDDSGESGSENVIAAKSSDGNQLDAAEALLKSLNFEDEKPEPKKTSGGRKKKTQTDENTDQDSEPDTGVYCVAFIRPVDGSRKPELYFRVFASNNVGAQRKQWQGGSQYSLKTEGVIFCKNGDADTILAAWDKLYSNKAAVKNKGWYTVSKDVVANFIDKITANENYEKVTESKAKKVKK